MGWFAEQLEKRKKTDEERLSASLEYLAASVTKPRVVRKIGTGGLIDDAVWEIVKYFGFTPRDVKIPTEIKKTEDKLEFILKPYGIMRREVILKKNWYKNAFGPMIGTLKEDDSPVALIPTALSGYKMIDFAAGTRVTVNEKNASCLKPEAICFYQPLPLRPLETKDLLQFMGNQFTSIDVILYAVAIIIPILLGMVTPLLTKWLLGEVILFRNKGLLISIALGMLGFTVSRLSVNMFKSEIMSRNNTKLDVPLQAALMGRVLSLKSEFFNKYSAGELATRIIEMEDICGKLVDTVGSVGVSTLFSLIYLLQAYLYTPELVGIAAMVSLLNMATIVIAVILTSRHNTRYLYQKTKTGGMTYPMITGIEKIKISGAENRMFSRWAEQYANQVSIKYNPPVLVKIWPALQVAVNGIGALFIFFRAYSLQILTEDYFAFTVAFGMIASMFTMLAAMVPEIVTIKPAFDLLSPILKAEPETNYERKNVVSLSGSIEFRNVSFTYDRDMPNVIDDLSCKVSPGEYVGIVGKTGCGKSTLLRLMLGFETPQRGSIYYDRSDLRSLDLKSLRRKVGSVFQEEKLFTGNLYENITIGAPGLPLEAAWEAAEIADIADDIKALPMGMHTYVYEGSGGLSGGQKQRLMIARAVAAKPRILLFDEATSALDNISQQKIIEALDKMNCTRIVVAHRLSTIKNCDRILVMDQGNIAEEGTYDELMDRNGIFAALVARQQIDFDE